MSSVIEAAIVTGQDVIHTWSHSTPMLRGVLEETGRFHVTAIEAPPLPNDMRGFRPDLTPYDVVVLNYNDFRGGTFRGGARQDLADYVREGGGLVLVHSASWSFPEWDEFARMAGLRWIHPGRSAGVRLTWQEGHVARESCGDGKSGHPTPHEFEIVVRDPRHPITQGLPVRWRHGPDDLYSHLCGPAENVTVLATAWANPEITGYDGTPATGQHEPVLFTNRYGEGRVFQSVLGHVRAQASQEDASICAIENVGFIATFQRGAEWAATGTVTQPLPDNFPTEGRTRLRSLRRYLDNTPVE